eukprot:Skav227475  [mRNA]  locus=scaffold2491:463135:465085:+ [translate_table: standard]
MLSHGWAMWHGDRAVEHVMPMVVLIMGLLMTNLLRSSMWRSLPLAMTSFVLAFRVVVEIPICQSLATMSIYTMGMFPDMFTQYSDFAKALKRDKIDLMEITKYEESVESAKGFSAKLKRNEGLFVAETSLAVVEKLWEAAHCDNSKWHKTQTTEFLSECGNYVNLVMDPGPCGDLGGIGSSNLLAFNAILFQEFKTHLLAEDAEKKFRGNFERWLSKTAGNNRFASLAAMGTKASTRLLPWPDLVDMTLNIVKAVASTGYQTSAQAVTSERPWTMNVFGQAVFELEGGWKIDLCKSFGLLLAAILPIRKKILQACHIDGGFHVALVSLHTTWDTLCLVTAWLLCTVATVAYYFGGIAEKMLGRAWEVVAGALREIGDSDSLTVPDLLNATAAYKANYVIENGLVWLRDVESAVPALSWSEEFFLQRAAGAIFFFAVSALLSKLLCPQSFETCLSVGVCGPLWLFTGHQKGNRGDVEEAEKEAEQTFDATIQGLWYVMMSRSLFLAVIIAFSWHWVDDFSVQLLFAAICNDIYEPFAVQCSVMLLIFIHYMSGNFAVWAVRVSRQRLEEDSDEAQEYVEQTMSSSSSKSSSSYGTFSRGEEP